MVSVPERKSSFGAFLYLVQNGQGRSVARPEDSTGKGEQQKEKGEKGT